MSFKMFNLRYSTHKRWYFPYDVGNCRNYIRPGFDFIQLLFVVVKSSFPWLEDGMKAKILIILNYCISNYSLIISRLQINFSSSSITDAFKVVNTKKKTRYMT